MKKAILSFFITAFIFMNICGCAPLIIGGAAGALGAYAVGKDTIQGDTDKSYEALWNSAVRVARARGTLKQEDASKGYIEMEDNASRVYIRLLRLTRATVRIRVSARKYYLPNAELAQDMFVKIMEEAK